MKTKILIAAGIIVLLVASIAIFIASGAGGGMGGEDEALPEDPRGLYGFGRLGEFTTRDLDDNSVSESILGEKKLTFINYWATWCEPCRDELPDFQALYDKYGDDVTFLTIIDDGVANEVAAQLADEYLPFATNVIPTENLLAVITSGYVPTSIIVDNGGNLISEQIIGALGPGYAEHLDAALDIVNYYEEHSREAE
ncbi:MAG: TlpA family protein disulfide reductase [Clostridiales Family XIII bacterium]|nr:TlpA family protein disulfide reductase [Clostridiales Family XIII bacterium]